MQTTIPQLQHQIANAEIRTLHAAHVAVDPTEGIAWAKADPESLKGLLDRGIHGQALMNTIFDLIGTNPRAAFGVFRALEAHEGKRYPKAYGGLSAALRHRFEPQKAAIVALIEANEYRDAVAKFTQLEQETGLRWTPLWQDLTASMNAWTRAQVTKAFDLAREGDPECARVYAHVCGQTGRDHAREERALHHIYVESVELKEFVATLPVEKA